MEGLARTCARMSARSSALSAATFLNTYQKTGVVKRYSIPPCLAMSASESNPGSEACCGVICGLFFTSVNQTDPPPRVDRPRVLLLTRPAQELNLPQAVLLRKRCTVGRVYLAALVLATLLAAGATAAVTALSPEAQEATSVTFHKEVLPILQKNCQTCHRPGSIAPMSLLTYDDARPWARSMKLKVASRQMPPWFADPQYGKFSNDRSLTQADIDTIVKWADSGAPAGDPKDAPAPIAWPADGWQIKPDVIVRGPAFQVPAHPPQNVIEWTSIVVPSGFTKDTWITSMELKPTDISVTHHICINFRPHTPDVQYYTPAWNDKPRDEEGIEIKKPGEATPTGHGRNTRDTQRGRMNGYDIR